MAAAPAPAPKKKRTGLIVLIVVLAVAIVGTGVFLGVKSVIGNRLTSYCQTFKSMETQMTDAATQMSTAASAGDISGVSDALDSMISSFTNLQTTNPPDTVSPALETFIRDFGAIKQATDTDGLEGFVTSYTTYASEIDQASTTIDDASVAYCT
jgi:hypothetical protein